MHFHKSTGEYIIRITWLILLITGYVSALYDAHIFLRILVGITGIALCAFYFYGSFFYFMGISIFKVRKTIQPMNRTLALIGFFAGTPLALAALSVVVLSLKFPGGFVIYLFSMFTGIAMYVILLKFRIKSQNRNQAIERISKHYKLYFFLMLFILLLMILMWPDVGVKFRWGEPQTIPGM